MDMDNLSEAIQAKWILRRILTDLGLDLDYTQYFHTVDLFDYIMHDGPSGKNQYMGLLRGNDYSPKPSFYALQAVCSLFDGETEQTDLVLFPRKLDGSAYKARFEIAAIESATFVRNGYPVYAYWYPSDFDAPLPPQPIEIGIWHGKAAELKNPVLVDPLHQQLFRLTSELKDRRGEAAFRLPLLDYPLIITDAAVLDNLTIE
jgi:hypothetical protein